jgi:hypothetical protein
LIYLKNTFLNIYKLFYFLLIYKSISDESESAESESRLDNSESVVVEFNSKSESSKKYFLFDLALSLPPTNSESVF